MQSNLMANLSASIKVISLFIKLNLFTFETYAALDCQALCFRLSRYRWQLTAYNLLLNLKIISTHGLDVCTFVYMCKDH
jgi:hypothetical protein